MRTKARLHRLLVAALAATSFQAGAARAQEREPRDARLEALEKKLAEQEKEIDELKKKQPLPAPSQTKQAGEAKEPSDATIDWEWDEGFVLKGKIKDEPYELRPRLELQADYRAFAHAGRSAANPTKAVPEDRFLMRRARVGFSGKLSVFGFDCQVDPVRSGLPLADFWLQYQQFEEFRIRIGHYKTPFTFEDGITTNRYIDTVERSMLGGSGAVAAPNLRPGVAVLGSFAGGLLKYWISAQNQPDANVVQTGDPLMNARLQSEIGGLCVGTAGIWARRGGAPQQSFPGQTPGGFQFFVPVSIRGWDQRYEVDVNYYWGPLWVGGEYVWAQQERKRILAEGVNGTPLVLQGFYVDFGYMFWGPPADKRKEAAVVPFASWELFSMEIEKKRAARNVGAEVVLRLEWIELDDARGGRRIDPATNGGAAPSTAPNAAKVRGNDAKGFTLGFNLYPTANVKLMADWVHLRIGDQARAERPHQRFVDEFLFRAQLEF